MIHQEQMQMQQEQQPESSPSTELDVVIKVDANVEAIDLTAKEFDELMVSPNYLDTSNEDDTIKFLSCLPIELSFKIFAFLLIGLCVILIIAIIILSVEAFDEENSKGTETFGIFAFSVGLL